ncbi:MAG: DUF3352 domain-containing protein [Planctomycetes bacterium]|nr:DUF3352 domain-containing protein [Planctomycetota bacterium]
MKFHTLSSLASIALLALPVAAQGSVMPYLPKDTIFAASTPDLTTTVADFAKMPLAKMWAEEEVQNFLADVKELAKKQWEQGMQQAKQMHEQGALPFDPEQLASLRVTGGTVALTTLSLAMGDHGPDPRIGVLVHLDFGSSATTWKSLIQMGLGMLQSEAGRQITLEETMVGDVKLTTFKPSRQKIEMGLSVAVLPSGVLIGTLASDVSSVIENMQKKTPVLAASAHYQAAAKHLDQGGVEFEMYMRPDPAIDFALQGLRMAAQFNDDFAEVDMDGVERALKAMGLRDLGTIAGTSTYVEGKSVTRGVHVSGDAAGTAAAPRSIDMAFLKWVPKDAVSFEAGTMDISSYYDAIVRGLEAYDADLAKQVLGQLEQMEQQLGFSVSKDLFGSIGNQYISWSMPMAQMATPEVAMLLEVKDEAKLVNALKKMADLSQGAVEIEEGEKRGVKAYQLHINADPMGGMGFNIFEMIQPTFAFKNGFMVIGLSAMDVKRVFQRMDREDDPKGDIRGNKEFAAVAASIPAGVQSVAFTDWKTNFESLYQLMTSLLTFVPMDDLPIDTALLPDAASLTKHLFASVSYSKTSGNVTESVATSPFGPEMMALGIGVGVGVGAAIGYTQAVRMR